MNNKSIRWNFNEMNKKAKEEKENLANLKNIPLIQTEKPKSFVATNLKDIKINQTQTYERRKRLNGEISKTLDTENKGNFPLINLTKSKNFEEQKFNKIENKFDNRFNFAVNGIDNKDYTDFLTEKQSNFK